VSNLLVDLIGHSDLEQVLASRDQFSTQLRDRLDGVSDESGVRVSFAVNRSIVPELTVTRTCQTRPSRSGPGSLPGGQEQ